MVPVGSGCAQPWDSRPSVVSLALAGHRKPAAALITGQPQTKDDIAQKGLDGKVAGPISNLIAVSFRHSDPASDTVDVSRPQPAPHARNPLSP